MTDWSSIDFRIWAVLQLSPLPASIPGPVQEITLEVSRCAATYALNSIPTAYIMVPVGRDCANLDQYSKIHDIWNKLFQRNRITVYISARNWGASSPDKLQFPVDSPEVKVLFDGYVAAPQFQKRTSGAGIILQLEHWLSDLNYYSCVSAISAPQNAAAFIFNAARGFGSDAANSSYTSLSAAARHFTFPKVTQDIWGKAMKPWLYELAGLEEFHRTQLALQLGLASGVTVNTGSAKLFVKDALDRIEPNAQLAYTYGRKTDLNLQAADGDSVTATLITNHISRQSSAIQANATIWNLLLRFCSDFALQVVPLPTRALIVPNAPLRTPYGVIKASEYEHVSVTGASQRALRGIAVYSSHGFYGNTGLNRQSGNSGAPTDFATAGTGGYYQGMNEGLIYTIEAPSWMAIVRRDAGAPVSAGVTAPTGNALNPGQGAPPPTPAPSQQIRQNVGIANRFARAVYVQHRLASRVAGVLGITRFDIGPGSNVLVEVEKEKFIGSFDQLGQAMFASVVQVDYEFARGEGNAPGQASTSLQLAHWRTALENTLDGTSLSSHPLYKDSLQEPPWTGSPLV